MELGLLVVFLFLPMYGIFWMGIRRENQKRETILKQALSSLKVVAIGNGARRYGPRR